MTDSNLKVLNKKVNTEINKVSQWMNLDKLKLNYDKCKYMLFKPSNKEIDDNITFQISLTNSIKLEQVKFLNYLGVVLDENLKWTNHIQLLCKKLAQVCGILTTIKPLVNSKTLLTKCLLLHGILTITIWHTSLGKCKQNNLSPLNKVHNRIIKMIQEKEYFQPNLLNIKQIYKLEIRKFMFRYNANQLSTSLIKYFTSIESVHSYPTRLSKQQNYFLT